MTAPLTRAELRLDALAFYQASVIDDDQVGACCVLNNTTPNDLITGLALLLDIVTASWASSCGVDRSHAVDLLRAANLAIAGVTE